VTAGAEYRAHASQSAVWGVQTACPERFVFSLTQNSHSGWDRERREQA